VADIAESAATHSSYLCAIGKSEQRGFVQLAGVMQAEDRTLGRREIATYSDCFGAPMISTIA